MIERGWDVLLVGGPSGAGKSSLAYPLARELGLPVLEIDDIVCALQAMTTPEQQPELFYWQTHPQALAAAPDEIVRQGIALTAALEPALAAIVGNHLETDMPVVIEGDFLRPSFTIQRRYADQAAGKRVRGIFVLEDDPSQIVANYAAREPNAGNQDARAAVSVAWSRWLAEEAVRHDVPVIASRPWTDLISRACAALGGS
ncbi:MAG TPA: AAA family ATPase [Micromonosporaceae bacterium]|nr:AAA family ATPase [Micromonosporaceae bacterium]